MFTKYLQTPDTIVGFFTSFFADRIAFSNAAIKSLKGCRLAPKDLWDILFNLSTVMWELMQSDCCPDPYKEFRSQTSIDASRGEGRMTRKDSKLMEQFKTECDGRVIDIEPHITYAQNRNARKKEEKLVTWSLAAHSSENEVLPVHRHAIVVSSP